MRKDRPPLSFLAVAAAVSCAHFSGGRLAAEQTTDATLPPLTKKDRYYRQRLAHDGLPCATRLRHVGFG